MREVGCLAEESRGTREVDRRRLTSQNHNDGTLYNRDEEGSTAAAPPAKTMSLILIERGTTSGASSQIHCNHGNAGLYCQGAKDLIH